MDINFFLLFFKQYGLKIDKVISNVFSIRFIKKPNLNTVSDFLYRVGLQHILVELPILNLKDLSFPFIVIDCQSNFTICGKRKDLLDVEKRFIEDKSRNTVTCIVFGNPNKIRAQRFLSKFKLSLFIIVLISLIFFSVVTNNHISSISILSAIGLIISTILIFQYTGNYSSQFCNISENFNCDLIQATKWGKIMNVPVPLFSLLAFSLQLYYSFFHNNFSLIVLISLFSAIVSSFYIVLMIRLRSACFYCITIHLIVYAILFKLLPFFSYSVNFNVIDLFAIIIGILTIASINYLLKQNQIRHLYRSMLIESQLDYEIFKNESRKFTEEFKTIESSITISNSEKILSTISCFFNTECSKCGESLNKLLNLIELFPNLAVYLFYSGSSNGIGYEKFANLIRENPYTTDEFRNHYKELPLNLDSNKQIREQDEILQKHLELGVKLNIVKTPTFYINNIEVPAYYAVDDFKYILNAL